MAKRVAARSYASRSRMRSRWDDPTWRFGVLTFALAALVALFIVEQLALEPVLAWLAAVTLVTFLAYGYDKAIAGSAHMRIPEIILLALTFAGGTLGALAGMWLFHHKTVKPSFRFKFFVVIAAQVVLVGAWLLWARA